MKLSFKLGYLDKKQQRRFDFFSGFFTFFLISIIGFIILMKVYIPYQIRTEKALYLKELENARGKQITIYKLKKGVEHGKPVDINNLDTINDFLGNIPSDAIQNALQISNQVFKVDLAPGTTLTRSCLVNINEFITNDLRKQDFVQFKLNTGLKKDDFIDIRIRRKDGTDDIFLAKKKVLDVIGGGLVLNINETENAYVNNATIEAAQIGAELYTKIYVDPLNQPAAKITYKLNPRIQALVNSNPNIITEAIDSLVKNNKGQNTPIKPKK